MRRVAVTGHRPDKLGGYDRDSLVRGWVCERLREQLVMLRPTYTISGMAPGVDQWWASVSLDLGIPFLAAIPFVGQERKWPPQSQREYRELLSRAMHVETVCTGAYQAWKMQRRNQWMVDNCDVLVAVWNGTPGGTANCVEYAQRVQRRIERIDPRDLVHQLLQ